MKKNINKKSKIGAADKAYMIILPVLCFVLLVLAAFGSTLMQRKEESSEYDTVMISLAALQAEAELENPELNKNRYIWEDELLRIRDEIPTADAISLGNDFILKEWVLSINQLINRIKTTNISDEEFASIIKDTLPESIQEYVFKNYFKSFTNYLTPGIFN